MATYLPDDILYMVCTELWHLRDFNTLFNCACAGKQLALPALANLYRMHDVAPVTNGGSDEVEISGQDKSTGTLYEARLEQQERIFMKWAGLWRTIILSSLGKTCYPYSRYIRTLNLRDLEELLQDSKFKDKISKSFFKGELARFKIEKKMSSFPRLNRSSAYRLDPVATLNEIGGVITRETPLLEDLRGHVTNSALSQCIPHLPHLANLNVWHGEALSGTGDIIRAHCPSFKTLKFWDWTGTQADNQLATFLHGLRPQSLQSFEIFSQSAIGAETFSALNAHRESLTELKLSSIPADAMPALSLLQGCTNLVSLLLAENIGSDFQHRHHDTFLDTIAWLQECKSLRAISFSNFLSAPALLPPILLAPTITLTKLEFEGYSMRDSLPFHQALGHQPTLQSLWLKGDPDDSSSGPALDALVHSLCKLTALTDLRLREISDSFTDDHIATLARHLPNLEVWWTSGYAITDAIWPAVAALRSLRRLDFMAMSSFTAAGILAFARALALPGNKGFSLAIMMADMDSDLPLSEQTLIRDVLAERVEGRFEFTLMREEISSFESESD